MCFQYDTKYYYKIDSGDSYREFWFQTPPKINPDIPYKFGIIGELFPFAQSSGSKSYKLLWTLICTAGFHMNMIWHHRFDEIYVAYGEMFPLYEAW